jgi:hypothetical protein
MEREERFCQCHPSHCNPYARACPTNVFRCMISVGHNCRVIIYNRRLTERQAMVKQWSEDNMEWDMLNWRQVQSNPPQGCLWWLWQHVFSPTEQFPQDRFFFLMCNPRLYKYRRYFKVGGSKQSSARFMVLALGWGTNTFDSYIDHWF